MLDPYLALLLVTLELEFNLDNVLKAFFDLWLLESRTKARKSRMRKNTPLLGIKFAATQRSNGVVVLA